MPVGVIVDALAVVIGGIVGAVVGKKLKKDFIDNMNLIPGLLLHVYGRQHDRIDAAHACSCFCDYSRYGIGTCGSFWQADQQGRTCAAERHQSFL